MEANRSRVKVKDASNRKEGVRFLPTLKHWVSSHDLYDATKNDEDRDGENLYGFY